MYQDLCLHYRVAVGLDLAFFSCFFKVCNMGRASSSSCGVFASRP